MPDVSEHVWECDWCGERFKEKNNNGLYTPRYIVKVDSITCMTGLPERLDIYVCKNCITKLNGLIKSKS